MKRMFCLLVIIALLPAFGQEKFTPKDIFEEKIIEFIKLTETDKVALQMGKKCPNCSWRQRN